MEFLLNFNIWFKSLPASGKISLFLVVIGVVVAGILLQSHYKQAGYQYLFTNLSLTDANAISEKLQTMGVEAKIQGDAVLVPGNRVLELRNMLASEGLPQGGGVGFELFDKKNFGETEFQQRVNYIRALQGELARTLSAIDGVEKARVHLVIPEKTLFQEDQKPPSASVAVTMFKGRKLTDGQIKGMVHLVTTSVEGMNESTISIIDQNGNILFKGAADNQAGLAARHLEMQRSLEANLESRVVDMLERVVGVGGVNVKVSSFMNFSQVERTVEQIDPESRVALNEQTTTETSSGNQGAAGGAPGATANLPGGAAAGSSGRSESSKRTETSATYAISKSVQKILEPVGTIQKLSVAVLVDGNYITAEDGTKTYEPRSAEDLKKLEDLVKSAVGFNVDRGDFVKVENMQFQRTAPDDKAQEEFISATNSSRWMMFLLDNGKLLGVVLIIGIVFIMMMRLVNSYAPPVNVAYANIIGQEAAKVAEALPAKAAVNIIKREDPAAKERAAQAAAQMELAQKAQGGEINFVESQKSITVEAVETSEEKLRLQAARMQAEQLIKSDMNEAVMVIRAWLADE